MVTNFLPVLSVGGFEVYFGIFELSTNLHHLTSPHFHICTNDDGNDIQISEENDDDDDGWNNDDDGWNNERRWLTQTQPGGETLGADTLRRDYQNLSSAIYYYGLSTQKEVLRKVLPFLTELPVRTQNRYHFVFHVSLLSFVSLL